MHLRFEPLNLGNGFCHPWGGRHWDERSAASSLSEGVRVEEWRSAVIAAESCGMKPSPAEIPGPLFALRCSEKPGLPMPRCSSGFTFADFIPAFYHTRGLSHGLLYA